ncbi:MAG: thiamine diphosphokinase [Clostridia bacterium]|nr:thiamine diphosphokinase [Clostridia bacterium]
MKRCVIVGGADIKNYDRIKNLLRNDDYVIYCDSGLKHKEALGIAPSLIIGDFDSWEKPETDIEIITLPTIKDDTDTVYAVKEAIKRGFDEFLLIGVTGGRLDHTLGNLSILLNLFKQGKKVTAADDYSIITAVGEKSEYISCEFAFFSLLAIDGEAGGVTIKNAKYPLEDAVITPDFPLGVSNEVLPGETAEVSVKDGNLILIKVF